MDSVWYYWVSEETMYAAEMHGTLSESYRSAVVSVALPFISHVDVNRHLSFHTTVLATILVSTCLAFFLPLPVGTCCKIVTFTG